MSPPPCPLQTRRANAPLNAPTVSNLQELTLPQGRQPPPLGGGGQSPKASSWLGPSLGSPAPVLKGQGRHEEESSWMKPFHLCHLLLVLHGS